MENLFITSFSNSQAQVIDAIRCEENTHWYLGLRKAELFIFEKKKALELTQGEVKNIEARKEFLNNWLNTLNVVIKIFHWIPLVSSWLRIYTTKAVVELVEVNSEFNQNILFAQTRDCLMELETAEKECERILLAHPEAREKDYLEIQAAFAQEALFQRKAHFIASRAWASLNGVPESVGALLLEVTPEEKKRLLEQECVTRALADDSTPLSKLIALLSTFSPDQQQTLLEYITSDHHEGQNLLRG